MSAWHHGGPRNGAPTMTPSMQVALKDLTLDHLYVVHGGEGGWPMADRVTAVAAADVFNALPRVGG